MVKSKMSLREANLAAFKGALGAFLKTFSERPLSSTLIEQDDDCNVLRDGFPVFPNGARADSRKLVDAVLKSPARILFGKPSMMFGDESADRAADEGKFEFETQRYDDANQDTHILDFQRAVAKVVQETGVEITEKLQAKSPYFVVSYGAGLGFHLRQLWEALRPANLIVLEADRDMMFHSLDVFDWASLIADVRAAGSALTLIIDEDAKKMLARLNAAIQADCVTGLDGLTSAKSSKQPLINVWCS